VGSPPGDYPVVLSVAGRPCLVVGGGPIAARKARGLLDCGALVTVVAPVVDPVLAALDDPNLHIEHRPYRSGDAADYLVVITATGVGDVDRHVVADAVAARSLVDCATAEAEGTIRLPAVHRDGPVTVAVSTRGSSPALARWLRNRISDALGSDVAVVATLLAEARRDLVQSGRSSDTVAWDELIEHRIVPLVRAGRIEEARSVLAEAAGGRVPPDPTR
jgi:precorrin-2 dehydrogenase/sirohydrochlorin ferrochelatase